MLRNKILIGVLFGVLAGSGDLLAGHEEEANLLEPGLGYTQLHEAAARGNIDRVKALLEDERYNRTPLNRMTPLHIAARFGHLELVRWLLADGRSFSLDYDLQNALHTAARYGQIEVMRELLQRDRFVTQDADGWTALHEAARLGQLEAVRLLLEDGRFDAPGCFGWTPLHVAAQLGNVQVINLLLQDGRFVGVPDQEGWSALHVAVDVGRDHIVPIFLEDGRFNAPANNGETPLHVAAHLGRLESLRHLLADGRFNLVAAYSGDTVLHTAARSNYPQALWSLICHFPNPACVFGANYRRIAAGHGVDPERRNAILAWPRPIWWPSHINLYPLHLRRALLEWLRVGSWNQGLRDVVAERIVHNYYADAEGWNPYNPRNTQLRLLRHQQEIADARAEERRQIQERLLLVLRDAPQDVRAVVLGMSDFKSP